MSPEHRTRYEPYGTGIYRREMLVEVASRRASCELIDDFHHFRAEIEHDGECITAIRGSAPRHPWATCPAAIARLDDLLGSPLASSMRGPSRHTRARQQCTHLFDAACLAVARAGRGAPGIRYAMAVPDRIDGRTTATLGRDGEPFLRWELDHMNITTPQRYAGHAVVRGGFAEWVESRFDADEAEAAMLLQRACVFSGGRYWDIERVPRADHAEHAPLGACHSYQPGTVEHAHRQFGSVRNLTNESDLRRASLAALPPGERERLEPS